MKNESIEERRKMSDTFFSTYDRMKANIKSPRNNKRLKSFFISPSIHTNYLNNNKFVKQSPKSRNINRKSTTYSTLNNYNKSAIKIKNIKNQFQSTITPTLSTFENEKENTKSTIEEEKIKNINKKISLLYTSYYKAYQFQTLKSKEKHDEEIQKELEKVKRNNYKSFLFNFNSPSKESVKKGQLLRRNTVSRSIQIKSKTSRIQEAFKATFNFQSPTIKKRKTSYIIRTEPSRLLRERVKEVVKEIDNKNRNKYIPKVKADDGRVKLVSLLNQRNGIIDETINFMSKKKFAKATPLMLVRKPTNNIEMNELIINSFGVGVNHIEFSKKLYDLNEVFFNLLETMKKKRTEMDIARFERTKRKYEDKDEHKINIDFLYPRNNRDKWEKKFMHDQYEYKLPEKLFKKFKKQQRAQNKQNSIDNAIKLSNLITKLDADEYEMPDEVTHNYRSSKSNLSSVNLKRISRLLKILKTVEDEEQTGNIILKADYLKKEQQIIENEMINIVGKSGKPRFVRNSLKPKTVDKFKSISGDFFGLPV